MDLLDTLTNLVTQQKAVAGRKLKEAIDKGAPEVCREHLRSRYDALNDVLAMIDLIKTEDAKERKAGESWGG